MGLTRDRLSDDEKLLVDDLDKNPYPKEWNKGKLVYSEDGNQCAPSSDNVNHPPHYNNSTAKCDCGRRIECIDITRHMPFNVGNAVKYLWRCEYKGNALEDLKKAAWYLNDEINKRENDVR